MTDTIASDWSRELTTRTGFHFKVRPAQPTDEAVLTGLKTVGHERLAAMTAIDHHQTENFLAFVDGASEIIATAMLACDTEMKTGEIAIAIRSDYKARGVSWDLLKHVAAYAEANGLTTIQSVELRANHAAIDMEREMGFVAEPYPGDPTLVLVKKRLNQD